MKKYLYLAVVALIPFSAHSATQSVDVDVEFAAALTLTKNNDVNFGVLRAGVADTYTIDTSGSVSAAGSGELLGGTTQAASITIAGSTTQTIDIAVNNFVANGGVTPSNATCDYNSGGSGTCALTNAAAPGAGKDLLIGLDIAVDGTQASGDTATPTFDVVVTYN